MRICVLGDRNDLSANYLGWCATERGFEVLYLWEDQIGIEWSIAARLSLDCDFRLEYRDKEYGPRDLDGVVVRLNPTPEVATELGLQNELESVYAVERRYGLQFVLDSLPVPVINRPSQGRANSSKPYQMLQLRSTGFEVPDFCVTNAPGRAIDFTKRCPDGAIYKACSGLRARVRRVNSELFEQMSDGSCPVLIQEYVPGVEVRVHVVGKRTFGTQIDSDSVDYRFDEGSVEYRSVKVPDLVASLCLTHCAREGITLAGFDFRVSPRGKWFCLESNPVPTFLPFEAGAGHAIGDAILDLFSKTAVAQTRASPLWRLAALAPGDPLADLVRRQI